MVDTVLLHYRLTHNEYDTLFKQIDFLSREKKINLYPVKYARNSTCYKTTFLRDRGILEFVFCKFCSKNSFTVYFIELKIHLKLLIENNILDLTRAIDMPLVKKSFNALMKELSPLLPEFSNWSCSRIDYAVTIQTPHVEIYIDLFKRGSIHKSFSKNIPQMLSYQGSFYLPSNKKSLTLNFYDKYDQLLKKSRSPHTSIDEKLLSRAKNTLRLEVQCHREKLQNIKNCRYFKDVYDKIRDFYFTPQVSHYAVLLKYLMLTQKSVQPFVSLNRAKEILCNSCLPRMKIMDAYAFLKDMEDSNGLWEFREGFQSNNAFNRAISLIKKAGINPLLIPARYEIDELPSLVPGIKSFLHNK